MKRITVKLFKGLVRYGQARHAMISKASLTVVRLNAQGIYSDRDAMETRVVFQRRFRRKVAE